MAGPTKIALSVPEACAYLGIGKSTLYRARAKGYIEFRKLCGRTVIMTADLDEWLSILPAAEVGKPSQSIPSLEAFDLEGIREVGLKARLAEALIIAEAAKMGIALDAGQACTFAQVALQAYGIK